ncbi:treacle protein isoform X2 [Rana temporaria]|uniref:treacle protein isoform X2 n=1 Tax=Rana temporaria TaxID=8407 RepID=UPI001AADF678|nr:treacle protein isoform X2 [Rana temporaria]
MVKSKSALLALIHQHLLKNGYAKAARELQRENGENFATSKITLQRVYKLWTKKSKKKKKKKEEAKHKKRDHDSKKADHLDLALPAKKSSGTKTKTKQVKKKMNLATEAAADVKVISKKASASLNDNPGSSVTQEADVFPDGNYSSVAASLKSKPGAEKSNGSSSSSETEEETTKQVARGKKNPDPVAAEQKSLSKPSNGKAEVSRSSADSDETDIDKLPAPVTSKPTVSSSQKASKGKRQAAPPVQKVQADSSTESSETDEDEPVKQVRHKRSCICCAVSLLVSEGPAKVLNVQLKCQ